MFAIYVMNGGNDTMYYIHKDVQGSFDVITDERGQVLERLSFDPWGRRRNATDWTYGNVNPPKYFDRGYTGHEHLDRFGLINMNGRVYDPWLGRFLSPDPIVQAPGNSQSYNRYSYCLNNPLKYTDPSGYNYKPNDWDMVPYINTSIFTAGSYHSFGPGSGNHWSDPFRNDYGNWMLMSSNTYISHFGQESYNRQVFTNILVGNIGWKATNALLNANQNLNSQTSTYSSDFNGAVVFGKTPQGSWTIAKITFPNSSSIVYSGEWTEGLCLFADGKVGGQFGGESVASNLAGLGFGLAAYWGQTLNTLYELNESQNLKINLSRAEGYKSITGTIPKSIRTSISYGKSMTTIIKSVGRGLFVMGAAMTIYNMATEPTTENLILGTADLVMGVISLGCPVVGLVYFTGRIIYDIIPEKN